MSARSPDSSTNFGSFLKYLRRRLHLTQVELSLAVGYTETHISRLENNQRLPDVATIAALFIPALDLNHEPELAARLLALAEAAHGKHSAQVLDEQPSAETVEIVGAIESIPPLPADWVRPMALEGLKKQLSHERLVILYGMPGTGKTTLAAALAVEAARASPVFWMTFTEGLTASVESLIRQLALFTLTLGQDTAAPLLTRRDPHARVLPLEEQLALLNQTLAGQDCWLCFDHVQLVLQDSVLMRALGHLAATTRARILLISREETALPEFTPVRMKGLEHEEALELVARLGITLAPAQIEQLLLKTAGSPMLLRLAGAQLREAGAERSALITHLETTPQVATYLLETVLRSLSEPARRLAECLSILRSPVDLTDEGLIRHHDAIIGCDRPGWSEAVRELRRRQLIENPLSAAFHPLIRDYIYSTLSDEPERRRSLHHLVADWLTGKQEEALPAAEHYCRAHDYGRAVEILADRAETIINLAQTDAAIPIVDELLDQARRQSSTEWQRALLTLRGDLLTRTTRAAEAESNYRQALALTSKKAVRTHIAARLAQNLLLRQHASEALTSCTSASRGVSLQKYPLLRAQIAVIECQAHLTLSHFDSALSAAQRAQRLIRRVSPLAPSQAAQLQAQVHLALGALAGIRGDIDAAHSHWRNAIAAARAAGVKSLEYRAHTNLGISLYQEGKFSLAIEHYQAALFGAQTLGDSILAARVLSNMAILHHLCGQLETALAEADQARQLRAQLGDRLGLANLDNTRASILLAQRHLAEAQTIAETVVQEAERIGHPRLLGNSLDTLAQIQLAAGDSKAAYASLERASELPAVQQDASLVGDLRRHLALVQLADGEIEDAERSLADLPEDGSPRASIELLMISAWLAFRRNKITAAQDHLALAQARIEASGCGLYRSAAERLGQVLRGTQSSDSNLALV